MHPLHRRSHAGAHGRCDGPEGERRYIDIEQQEEEEFAEEIVPVEERDIDYVVENVDLGEEVPDEDEEEDEDEKPAAKKRPRAAKRKRRRVVRTSRRMA